MREQGMDDAMDMDMVCEILRELQRGFREDPFFAELFGSRDTGFRAASSGVAPEAMSDVSREQIAWTWAGLCERLGVPVDIEVEDIDDLLETSPTYTG
jgi:hypothetical protein